MTDFIVKKFIKDYDNVKDKNVRQKYGTLSSIVGIICNIFLFAIKYTMGLISNSISIISDAFNNLSDCASCIITFLGLKLASKPADKEHPFGHGRMEYIVSLVIASIILVAAFELGKESIDKIIHPAKVQFSAIVLVSLIFSILVKLWMATFNLKLGKKINSSVMIATAKDSKSDVIATATTIISLVAACFTDLPVDGFIGVIVTVFIAKAGVEIIKETVNELLGKPAEEEVVNALKDGVLENEKILGIHDLILHSYGPGNTIGSCHVEVSSKEDILLIHNIIDDIERKIYLEQGILLTIHMDPVETDNELVNELNQKVRDIISKIDEELSFHDFRVVPGPDHTNIIFDIVVPYNFKFTNQEIKEKIDSELKNDSHTYYTVITFDSNFV